MCDRAGGKSMHDLGTIATASFSGASA